MSRAAFCLPSVHHNPPRASRMHHFIYIVFISHVTRSLQLLPAGTSSAAFSSHRCLRVLAGSLGCGFNPGTYLGLPSRGRDRAASPAPPGIYDLSCKHEINSLLIVLSSVQTVISMVNERALLCELRRPAGLWPRELLRISIMVRALSQPASLIQAALMAGAQTSK